MREDNVLLLDVLNAARSILDYVRNLSRSEFEASRMVQSAVLREIQVIGEAARLLSETFKAQHPEIAWAVIAGMRNRVIHEYFRIDLEIVWNVTQEDISQLIAQLEPLLPLGEPDPST